MMACIAERLKQIQENIATICEESGRNQNSVKLIVVTKTASIDQIKQVIQAGCYDLGENRAQHLKQAADEIKDYLSTPSSQLPERVNWHMIGHLQRNKVKQVLKMAGMIHSVDTLRLGEELNTHAGKIGSKANILMQINCSKEPQKYGVPVGAATHLAEQFMTMPNITLKGIMTMAPLTDDEKVIGSCFRRAREIFEEIRNKGLCGPDFTELSMGMSQDYPIAIREGATLLRIGSAVFSDNM